MTRLLSTLASVSLTGGANPLNPLPNPAGLTTIQPALQLVFGLAGGIALLVITVAGFQYVISQGNPQSTAKAKDTILYDPIGLVV